MTATRTARNRTMRFLLAATLALAVAGCVAPGGDKMAAGNAPAAAALPVPAEQRVQMVAHVLETQLDQMVAHARADAAAPAGAAPGN